MATKKTTKKEVIVKKKVIKKAPSTPPPPVEEPPILFIDEPAILPVESTSVPETPIPVSEIPAVEESVPVSNIETATDNVEVTETVQVEITSIPRKDPKEEEKELIKTLREKLNNGTITDGEAAELFCLLAS